MTWFQRLGNKTCKGQCPLQLPCTQFPVWAEIGDSPSETLDVLPTISGKPAPPFQDQILHIHHANYTGQCKYLPLWAWLNLEILGSKSCPSKGWDNSLIPQEGSFLRLVLVLSCPIVFVLFYYFWKSPKKQDWAPDVLFHNPLWGGDHQPRLFPQRPASIPVSVLPYLYRVPYW